MSSTDTRLALNQFLISVEARAFCMAYLATKNSDDALDIVQDSMMKLVQKYSEKSVDEWRPLFYAILNSHITDWHRKQSSRGRWHALNRWFGADQKEYDLIEQTCDPVESNPEVLTQQQDSIKALKIALNKLPKGQQQAFMFRCWATLNTRDTAVAMKCGEGTVKTQYSRALKNLQQELGEHWP